MSEVNLSGPLNTSINLRYGSTGLPVVSVIDPAFPRGGYNGQLEAGPLQDGIARSSLRISELNKTIAQAELDIAYAAQRVSSPDQIPYYIQSKKDQIAAATQTRALYNNSLQEATYLLNNLPRLLDQLKAANAVAPNTNVALPNQPNQKPATIVTETATTVTTRTNGVDIVVDKKSVVTETSTTVTTRTGGVDIIVDKPPPISVTEASLSTEPFSITSASLVPDTVDVLAELGDLTPPPILDPATLDPVESGAQGLSGATATAAAAATAQDQANFTGYEDWRVRLALAPGSNYLYNAQDSGILQPLKETNGIIFPYTPAISVSYAASYEGSSLTHTNYKIYQYQNSSVDQVTISCDFTAQDVSEANYLLAVIHFFRSMTKMFYGQDSNPKNGTPPPLCYLFGMGGYQFDALPLAISGFNYQLPTDVDYIKTTGASAAGTPQPSVDNGATNPDRLGGRLAPGGVANPPNYGTTPTQSGVAPTWVPTKIQLSITCLPIMSRNQVSNNFSLKDYATGKLLEGTKRKGGGFW